MVSRTALDIGIITDEIARDLSVALDLIHEWGIRRIELREGSQGRFPDFTPGEIGLVEQAMRDGLLVTAVSPGVFKGPLENENALRRDLSDLVPRAMDLAVRLGAPKLIIFGFERYREEPKSNRTRAMKIFEETARRAEEYDLHVVVENEPNFWVDRPRETASMLEEIGHPRLHANWDPANVIWGGYNIRESDFKPLAPFVRNVHVKDFDANDAETPWRAVGMGDVNWREILSWILAHTDLEHVTLETHCEPLIQNSRRSLENLRAMLREQEET